MSPFKTLKALFTSAPGVKPADCADRIRSGMALLVDVRETSEWSQGVAESAVLLPLSDLKGGRAKWKAFLAQVGDREVFVYCASGIRSGMAARILSSEGYRASNAGGLGAWADSGWKIVPPALQG